MVVGLLQVRWDSPGTLGVLEFLQSIIRGKGLNLRAESPRTVVSTGVNMLWAARLHVSAIP